MTKEIEPIKANSNIVAIVGRANVGKSSLFNAIVGRREAIVADEPGTTRDSISARVEMNGKEFWLVDTAGLKSAADDFEMSIQEQITQAAAGAGVILVVTEANIPITEEDRRVARMALKSRKPVFLVVNKADRNRRASEEDWVGLGIKRLFFTSATQKVGLEELLEALEELLPNKAINEHKQLKVALLGRPNVGKSTLFNRLAVKQQAIVSARAGTTRDVNRINIRYHNQEIELMDTAGIRRNGKIERGVEKFSVLRSLSAIEESSVCVVVLDVSEMATQLDQKIANMVKEAGKGLIVAVNKWDALEKDAYTHDQLAARISADFTFTPWAPLVFISAETGQNVSKLFELVIEIDANRKTRFKTPELNNWLRAAVDKHPPAGLKNRQPKLNYITQEFDNEMPSFKVFGSETGFLHWSYKRYLETNFRQRWPLNGTPLKFWFIEKH